MKYKQTAVEWLIQNIVEDQTIKAKSMTEWINIFDQSKAMEKEQHFELYKLGNSFLDSDNLNFKDYFDQYYNETYGK